MTQQTWRALGSSAPVNKGQILYLVDWELQFPGLKLFCVWHGSDDRLERERTNLSKNQRLFPIHNLEGAPHWCIVAGYKCAKCKCTCHANKAALLYTIPEAIWNEYPYNPKYSGFRSTFGFTVATSNLMEDLLLTHGNGDIMARLSNKATDDDYVDWLWSCLLHWTLHPQGSNGRLCQSASKVPRQCTQFCHSTIHRTNHPWVSNQRRIFQLDSEVSDYNRHRREL